MKRPHLTLTLAAAIWIPSHAMAAQPEPYSRVAALTGFFRWEESIPVPLRDALRAYQEGRFFAALGSLDEILAAGKPAYALDDAHFLRALSLIALGWDELAAPSLKSVLEIEPPGPYYIPALLELIEAHDRAGRSGAIADEWERYVDLPLRSGGSRSERVGGLLFEFGTLRPPSTGSTKREKSLLSKPKDLAVILEKRRERASDRLLYRSGLALFRLGRHGESLRALRMIGIESPYYPYAQYSIAQDLFALGKAGDAARALSRLKGYPKITQEERALGSRSQILHAAIRFETGDVERGIRIARSIAEDDPEAPGASLLITTALLDAGEPALALAYDTAPAAAIVEAEGRRALTISAAYASLGDMNSAAQVLRGAAGRVHEVRAAGAAREEVVDRLSALAEGSVRERREREQAVRAQVSGAIRVVVAHDGPWSLGTMLRRARAALGAGPYRRLAQGMKPQAAKTASNGRIEARPSDPDGFLRLAYLASPRRAAIELALYRLAGIESEPRRSDAEESLRILNGYLLWLEQAPADQKFRSEVARRVEAFADHLRSQSALEIPALRFDPGASVAPEVASFRRRLSETPKALGESHIGVGVLTAARDEVASLLRSWVDGELRELLQEREVELHDLEFDLEVALSETLDGGRRPTRPLLEERPR